jgi:hypothetical protein
LWKWKPYHPSFWGGHLFVIGSILFIFGAIAGMIESVIVDEYLTKVYTDTPFAIGATCYLLGAYLFFVEGCSEETDLQNVDVKKLLQTEVEGPRPMKWSGTWEPQRLSWLGNIILLVGAAIYPINSYTPLIDWILQERWRTLVFISVPSTLGSMLSISGLLSNLAVSVGGLLI